MIIYEVPLAILLKFADRDIPYLSFDKFHNVAKLYRDEYFACQYIDGFMWDVGVKYNVWTRDLYAKYHRHVFFDAVKTVIKISFEIPHLTKNATVPLNISIFDEDGVYFTMNQDLAFDVKKGDKWKVTSWRKIEPIRDGVMQLCN